MTKVIDSGFISFRLRALLALALVSGFLFFAIYKNEAARTGGAEIVLETRPIDPRDIFFGHYAILSYDLQRIISAQAYDLMDDEFRAEAKRVFENWDENQPSRREGQQAPAYIALKRVGDFHIADFATLDPAKAKANGALYLKADWSVNRHFKKCEESRGPGIDCAWVVSIISDLPRRYYADKKTALALQNLQRAAQRFDRDQRAFQDCEQRREVNEEGDPAPNDCENVTTPAEEAEKFGVVLSLSEKGDVVIKGIVYGDRRVIDSLNGPRLTEEQLEQ